jgi:predicted aspartyl protease
LPALAQQPLPPSEQERLKARRDEARRLTVTVTVNGKGPYQFLVDTGANRSGIAREVAQALGLPAGQPTRVHGIASAYIADTVDIAELSLGHIRAELKDTPVYAADDLGADGLIGLDVLKDHVVNFDLIRSRITVTRGMEMALAWSPPPGIQQTIVYARQRFGQLTIIDADAAHTRMTCFIDTGAEQSVGNTPLLRAIEAHPRADRPELVDMIHGATGQYVEGRVAWTRSLRVGGVSLTNFYLAFADLHTFELWELTDKPALLIGMDILRLFDQVAIDFPARRVGFQARRQPWL